MVRVGDLVILRTPMGQKSPSNFGIIIEMHPDAGFGDSCRVYWDAGFWGGQWFFGSVGFFPLRFQEIQKFDESSTFSTEFGEIFIKIGAKFDENCEKYQNFERNFENCKNFPTKIC